MSGLARRLEAWLPRLPRAVLALLLAAMVLGAALPAFTGLPVVDRDEARFSQSSKQMADTGALIDIRFRDEPRYKKPVGIYWLQAATVAVLGPAGDTTIWHYRLPSLAAAVGAVVLTAEVGAVFGAGLVAGLLMAGVFLVLGEAHLATTDAVLLLTVVAAQLPLARLYRAAREAGFAPAPLPLGQVVLFWGALAVSILVKGPVGPMVVALTVLALGLAHRRGRWLLRLRPKAGLVGLLAVVLPWFVAITLTSGGAFWAEALGHDLAGKVVSAQENHGAPPGTYLALVWITFFPASIPLALSLPAIWRARRLPGVAFAAAWALPAWAVFEAAPTKLMHYPLPLYPALALATALAWGGVARRWQWGLAGALALLPLALLLAAAGYGLRLGAWGVLLPLGLALVVYGLGAVFARGAARQGLRVAPLLGLWLMGAGFAGGVLGIMARIPQLWPSPAILALARPTADCPARPLFTAYGEPSLIFASPAPVRDADAAAMAAALKADRCAVAVADDPAAFGAAAQAAGVQASVLGRVTGLNLGSGKPVALTVYGVE